MFNRDLGKLNTVYKREGTIDVYEHDLGGDVNKLFSCSAITNLTPLPHFIWELLTFFPSAVDVICTHFSITVYCTPNTWIGLTLSTCKALGTLPYSQVLWTSQVFIVSAFGSTRTPRLVMQPKYKVHDCLMIQHIKDVSYHSVICKLPSFIYSHGLYRTPAKSLISSEAFAKSEANLRTFHQVKCINCFQKGQ